MVTAILVAAGKSDRMGTGTDKAFLNLGSRPVIAWSLLAFEHCPDIDQIVLVVRKEQQTAAKALVRMFGISKIHAIVPGGKERQDSVMAGLKAMDSDTRLVAIHDGARPCIQPDAISEVVKFARRCGAAVIGRRIWDTVKYVEKGSQIGHTEDRSRLWTVQTPQVFAAQTILKAYDKVVSERRSVTDDSAAVELLGEPVKILESNMVNPKITTVEDLQVAAGVLKLK